MSSTVQNGAFTVIEILEEIFAHLVEDPEDVSDTDDNVVDQRLNRGTLLNAALCCKTFLQPALNALWWSIDDTVNYSCYFRASRNSNLRMAPYIFLTSLLATMTGFVLTGMPDGFGICACHISDIDASIYTRLIQQRKTLPLLPRLSTLFLRTYGSGVLSILSPTLHSVVVSMVEFSRDDIPAVWVLMDVLSDTMAFHRLEKFSLELGDFHLPSLVRAPSRMTNLRQLSILEGTLTDLGILADLSTLPYLEDLGIDSSPFAAFATLSQFPLTPFVALKAWSLTISPLIEPFEPEKKCHASLARYFQIISSRFSASMTTLVVEWWHDSAFDDGLEMPPPKNAFNVSLFEPLFETRNLQKVDLSELHWAMETFGDEEFAKFASAWPAIQELKFPSYRMKATIRTLQSFATERPRLRHLEIPFDGQPVEESTLPMTSSPLETLSIGYTPIIPRKDESRLVRNLDRLFPSLQAVSDPLEKVLGFPAAHVEKSAHPCTNLGCMYFYHNDLSSTNFHYALSYEKD